MSLTNYHSYQNSIEWRLTQLGVEVKGSGLERTPGEPSTITRIWEQYHREINAASQEFDVPAVLIIATAATESSGNANAMRKEPKYTSDSATPHQISAGIMQTLISTARATLNNPSINRQWLFNPLNSFRAGTSYIAEQKPKTNFDPPKVGAAYNAGGVYHQKGAKNRWKMRQYPIGTGEHCDRFVRWFNDAVYVLDNHSIKPVIPYSVLLGGAQAPEPTEVRRESAKVVIKSGVKIESDETKAIIEFIRAAGVDCRITSVVRSKKPSRHAQDGTNGRGLAVDLAGPQPSKNSPELLELFKIFEPVEDQLYELIYSGAKYNIKRGKRVNRYAIADHWDHVHISVNPGVFIKYPFKNLPIEEDEDMVKYALIQPKGGGPTFGVYVAPEAMVVGKEKVPAGTPVKIGFTNANILNALKSAGYIPSDHIEQLEQAAWDRLPHVKNI